MAKRIVTKIGDIFCVEVDNAYKRYFQYFCNDMSQLNSSVIRVFKKRYLMDYCPTMEEIVSDEVDFYAHTILRNGIDEGAWLKVGKTCGDFSKIKDIPLFGSCQSSKYINGETIFVDPNTNWYIWKIDQPHIRVGELPRQLQDVVERGGIFPCVEIVNRIRLGYYRWNSPAYNSLKRKPYEDADSYIRIEGKGITEYLHFKGENVIQRIKLFSEGDIIVEAVCPLTLPKFWETNWDIDDFITAEEFDEVWKKYADGIE